MAEPEENPIVNGFIALVTVAIVVGLLAGIALLVVTNVLGIGGGGKATTAGGTGGESLYLPDPVPTESQSGPLVTLHTPPPSGKSSMAPSPSPSPSKSEEEKPAITLSQGAFKVQPGEDLYLSGIYPTGEGAVLDIYYRIDGGTWEEFPVDVNVSGGTFSVYVNTSRTGEIEWRTIDKSRNVKSNVVKVQHGG